MRTNLKASAMSQWLHPVVDRLEHRVSKLAVFHPGSLFQKRIKQKQTLKCESEERTSPTRAMPVRGQTQVTGAKFHGLYLVARPDIVAATIIAPYLPRLLWNNTQG